MGKRKQPDFQKTKLRVGRKLPRGQNVTDTSFKSKRILVPDQRMLVDESSSVTIPDQLRHMKQNLKSKVRTLQVVSQAMQENFSIEHLPIALEKAGTSLLDVEPSAREAALKLFNVILSLSPTLQIEGHMQYIVRSLRCGMTHCDIRIRKDSLLFLDVLLCHHPRLLNDYHSLLSVILDMISSHSLSKSHRKSNRRTLPAVYDENVKSQVWRMDVLKRFERFLSIIVESSGTKNEDADDEKLLFWFAVEPLRIDLFAGGGLKPLDYDLAKDLKLLSNNVDIQLWSPEMLKIFIDEVSPVLMDVFAEEISEFISQLPDPWMKCGSIASLNISLANCFLPTSVAQNINIIVQIFCSLGKWVLLLSNMDRKLEAWFVDKFCNICESLMKGFPYCLKVKSYEQAARNGELAVERLNLALCFLCCGFSVERSNYFKYRSTILKYMIKVTNMKQEIRMDSIPMVIRIAKSLLLSKHLDPDTANSFLHFLCESIQSPNQIADPQLIDFFTEILTDFKYQDLVAPSKEFFYKTLIQELIGMCSTENFNLQLLKNMKRICCLDDAIFHFSFESFRHEHIMTLLRMDHEDAQEVAAYFLCHYEPFDLSELRKICEVILNPDFSLKATLYIIRTISERFSKEIKNRDKKLRIAVMKFLMNVAVDTYAIVEAEKFERDEDLLFHETWPLVEQHCSYKINPSAHWRKHSTIFQECRDCLDLFPMQEKLQSIFSYCRNILMHYSVFPVHSVIALWNFKQEFHYWTDSQFNASYDALIVSCLFYCSIYAHDCKDRDYFMYGVCDLIKSFDFHLVAKTPEIIGQLHGESIRIGSIDTVEFFLRILHFLVTKEYYQEQYRSVTLPIFYCLVDKFREELPNRQLWKVVCEFFDGQ